MENFVVLNVLKFRSYMVYTVVYLGHAKILSRAHDILSHVHDIISGAHDLIIILIQFAWHLHRCKQDQ